jgi:transcription initiation factor IIF auxiliary subunit
MYLINSKEVSGVEPRVFREGGKWHHRVRINIITTDTDNDPLDGIRSVQYELHPSFRQRIWVATDIINKFEIKIWTYGYFRIQATLLMIDGASQIISGFVKW